VLIAPAAMRSGLLARGQDTVGYHNLETGPAIYRHDWRCFVAKVFVPTMLQATTGGVKEVDVSARNVRQAIEQLDQLFPGISGRLMEDDEIRPNLAVAVDGEVARMGLLERVGQDTEIHFVPAIGGGI
jgi:molybdopterin synthase sulfur carrier subunit